VVKLVALSPCDGLLPLSEGGVTVTEVAIDTLMSVAPYAGHHDKVSAALQTQVGAKLPPVGRRGGAVTWAGHGAWMVADAVSLDGMAAVTDQSDAWAIVRIDGPAAEDVLARLVPIDLRASVFAENHVAKTMLSHLSVTITRVASDAFEVMVMRSMAGTLVHDLATAARGVALR